MRKPVIDYRKLRLSNICSPSFRHLFLILDWVIYLIMFALTERFIPADKCYPVHCSLDDIIPFCEYFIIPYAGWYILIIGTLLYFLFYDVESFKELQKYIIITQVIAMTAYIVFPTRQDLRPDVFVRDNIFTDMVRLLYRIDTNTGVCPSLHVGYSLGIASAFLKAERKTASPAFKAFIVVFVILICISVTFVKQHSVVDIIAALPMCLVAELAVYGKRYFKGGIKDRYV